MLSGLALLGACGAQIDDAKSTAAAKSAVDIKAAVSTNTAQTDLLSSLALLYPNGQVPEAYKTFGLGAAASPVVRLLSARAAHQKVDQASSSATAAAVVDNQATSADYLPVTRIQNTSLYGAYFFTIYDVERAAALAANPLWRQEGTAFWASAAAGTNLSPVHRFRNLSNGSHMYTIYDAERADIVANYAAAFVYEGVAWYAQ